MVTRLFPERTAGEASRTPPGCVVWAVGDIHGRSDLVDRLFQAIRADLDVSEAKRKVVVLLGDYVDRGLDSRGVLNQICNLAADPGLEVHVLRGNHEEQMELFLRDPSVGPAWCEFGGRATLVGGVAAVRARVGRGCRAPREQEGRNGGEGDPGGTRDCAHAVILPCRGIRAQ